MNGDARARAGWELADVALAGMAVAVGAAAGLWAGAWAAAVVGSFDPPAFELSGAAALLARPGDPSAAWGTPMPGPGLYWSITALVLLAAGAIAWAGWRAWVRSAHHPHP